MLARLPSRAEWPVTVVALAAVYYFAARYSLRLAFEATNASPVWPPSGIAFAAIFLLGYRVWPGIALGALVANVVVFTTNQVADLPTIAVVSSTIAIGNTLEALLGVFFLRRLVGTGSPFNQPQDVFKFVFIALSTCVIAAAVGTASLLLGGLAPPAALRIISITWWLGDAAGVLIVAPVLIAWFKQPTLRWQSRLALEVVGSAILLIGLGAVVFGEQFLAHGAERWLAYLFIPCLAWAAFRYGPRGVATASLLVTGMAVWGTTHGLGPFAKGNLNDSLIVLESFIGLCAVTGLVLAADLIERVRLQRVSAVGRDIGTPWVVLLGCLGVAVVGWHVIASDTERQARDRFEFQADGIKSRIGERMLAYEEILRGGVGLFAASQTVGRQEWRDYAQRLRIEEHFPGLQAIAYAAYIIPADKDAHIRQIRAEGFPDYVIRPEGERSEYTSIVYIEPFNEPSRRAFGYDMFSEPVRRAAMVRARDIGDAAVTDKVTLVTEANEDVQAGFLMYLPVYRKGVPSETAEERRAALIGYVSGPFRMNSLMQGILGKKLSDVALEIFDGAAGAIGNSRMYSSENRQSSAALNADKGGFATQTVLNITDHPWTLRFTSLPAFEQTIDRQKAQIVLLAGVGISLLFFTLVRSLSVTRERALALANDMTAAMREAETKFQSLAQSANEAITISDAAGRIVFWNRGAQAIFGYAEEEIIGRELGLLLPDHHHDSHRGALALKVFAGQANAIEKSVELVGLAKDGHEFPVELSQATWETGAGRFYSSIIRDITERQRAEEARRTLAAILEASSDFVGTSDFGGRIRYINPAGRRLRGIELDADVTATSIADYYPEWVVKRLAEEAAPMAMKHGVWVGETAVWDQDGREVPIQHMVLAQKTAQGRVEIFASIMRDISAAKQAEQQLKMLAEFDSLTGLANRHQFNEKLAKAISRSEHGNLHMAIMFMDIDSFKAINDTLGHQGGDEVLKEFARRLQALVRPTDTVARLAGDEFVIILEGLKAPDETQIIASKIVHSMDPPFTPMATALKVTASVGVAVRRGGEMDAAALLHRADEALYMAKTAGRNTFRIVG